MRLIDAEFEEKHYTSMLLTPTPDVTKLDQKNARIVIDALKMAPTVDTVPVVRCGKCKHWRPYGRDFVLKKDYGRCEKPDNESLVKYNAFPYEDWFCADGERKGGDE